MSTDFETKLAAAGEIFEKLASERGLTINDFSDDEAADILQQIMEGDTSSAEEPKLAEEEPVAAPVAPASAPAFSAEEQKVAQLLYAQAYQEVTKMAAAQNIDVTTVDPEELHDAVLKQAALMSDPTYQAKVAALQEKVAEADMLGRVMAHSYVDELAKIAAKTAGDAPPSEAKDEDKDKNEKKASLVAAAASLRAKQAGEVPPQFAKDKDEKKDEDKDKEKEEAEKKASFVAARVQAHLLAQGIDPTTGQKLASAEEIDAEALKILKEKGWIA